MQPATVSPPMPSAISGRDCSAPTNPQAPGPVPSLIPAPTATTQARAAIAKTPPLLKAIIVTLSLSLLLLACGGKSDAPMTPAERQAYYDFVAESAQAGLAQLGLPRVRDSEFRQACDALGDNKWSIVRVAADAQVPNRPGTIAGGLDGIFRGLPEWTDLEGYDEIGEGRLAQYTIQDFCEDVPGGR